MRGGIMGVERSVVSKERVVNVINGWMVLLPLIVLMIADIAYLANGRPENPSLLACLVVLGLGAFGFVGFFSLQPNEARVLTLFGAYKGTVRASGFWWANPLFGGGGRGFGGTGALARRPPRTKAASGGGAGAGRGG